MRIGIDAFQLVPGQGRGGGFYTYFKNLMTALLEEKGANSFVIFINPELAEDLNFSHLNCEVIIINLPSRRNLWIFRLMWMHIILPVYAKIKRLDVMFFPFDYGAAYCPIPSVVTIHDLIDLYYLKHIPGEGKRFRMMYSVMMKWISVQTEKFIMAVTEETKKDILQCLVPPPRPEMIRVIHEGVGAEWFSTPRLRCNQSTPYIFSILSTSRHKNFEGLLKAYYHLRENKMNVRLVLAGMAGQSHTHIIESLNSHPYSSDIEILGFISNDELIRVMANAKVFVFVSMKEGFGLPILEAMAAGVPVVTSCISSMPEVAGNAALLVNPFDSTLIAKAIESVLRDQNLSRELQVKGRERASKFKWAHTAQNLLAFIEEIYKSRSRKARNKKNGI